MDEQTLATAMVLALESFDNSTLTAFNIAIQRYGRVPLENIAYNKALDCALIDKNGEPCELETLKIANAYEVNRRAKTGIFIDITSRKRTKNCL
ncbi:MAG: hypothetical protein G01um101429_267 [Parcubacteria group bacterium Gr01-1014_29]|nr:MAG: hypothetical protein G01um101429_267 [Parcubacteria group bacterium Gr01-1014_29]